jgi:hypothetical protein
VQSPSAGMVRQPRCADRLAQPSGLKAR